MRSPHHAIEAVLFDFDGVLTRDRTGTLTTLRYLSAHTGIEHERLQQAFRRFNRDLNLGRTSHREIWPELCRTLGRDIDIGLLAPAFESTPMNAAMWRLARQLKPHHRVGIVTDNKKDRIDHLRRHARLAELFDPIVVSAEAGAGKDGARIFELALQRLALRPERCVFIDNSPQNLAAPRALGLHAIHFDDAANDVAALAATLRDGYGLRLAGEGAGGA